MKSDERRREQSLVPLWRVYSEDFDSIPGNTGRARGHKESRKAKQLCRQVAETLGLVFSGDCRDELLQALQVLSVIPAPNSSRLLVTVFADVPLEDYDRRKILDRLDKHTGRLRTEVAASIHRKRVPSLAFRVLGPPHSTL